MGGFGELGDNNYQGYLGVGFLILLTPIYLISSWLFWLRRDMQPIKARVPALVIAANMFFLLFTAARCIEFIYWDTYPCVLDLWQDVTFSIAVGQFYCARAWLLFFKFELTNERIEIAQAATQKADDSDRPAPRKSTFQSFHKKHTRSTSTLQASSESFRFMDNTYLGSASYWLPRALIVSALELVPAIIITIQGLPEKHADPKCQDETNWVSITIVGFNCFYLVVFMVLGVKLRHAYDNFYLKTELKITAVTAIIAFVCFAVIQFYEPLFDLNEEEFSISTVIIIVLLFSWLCLSTIWPLLKTYNPQAIGLGNSTGDIDDDEALHAIALADDKLKLIDLLSSHRGYESFQNFLAGEFSVENLLFWKDIEKFKNSRLAPFSDLLAWAQDLYDDYILRAGTMAVNVPAGIIIAIDVALHRDSEEKPYTSYWGRSLSQKTSITQQGSARSLGDVELERKTSDDAKPPVRDIQHPALTEADISKEDLLHVFDDAEREVFHLMETDSFVRFKRSMLFGLFVANVRQEEEQHRILEDAGLSPAPASSSRPKRNSSTLPSSSSRSSRAGASLTVPRASPQASLSDPDHSS